MNYTRNELLLAEATMNQMRNAIYHLARFMQKNDVKDISHRLRRMGKNIAKTYIHYWKPTDSVNLNNIKEVIATAYKRILNSTVSVEINEKDRLIVVHDSNCALCKYHYEDIEIAGCEILLGLITQLIKMINGSSKMNNPLFLEPAIIQESRALGNNSCVQVFKYNFGGK